MKSFNYDDKFIDMTCEKCNVTHTVSISGNLELKNADNIDLVFRCKNCGSIMCIAINGRDRLRNILFSTGTAYIRAHCDLDNFILDENSKIVPIIVYPSFELYGIDDSKYDILSTIINENTELSKYLSITSSGYYRIIIGLNQKEFNTDFIYNKYDIKSDFVNKANSRFNELLDLLATQYKQYIKNID